MTISNSYPDARAHLLDELRWLNRLLAAHALRLRQANFYDSVKDWRGFFVADEEIDGLLSTGVFENDGETNNAAPREQITQLLAQARQLREMIEARLQATLAQNLLLPLPRLAASLGLSQFEQQVLVICLAPQIDARYEKIYAYLQNDLTKKFASVDLVLGLLCENIEARLQYLSFFQTSAPLQHFFLVENVENEAGSSASQRFLRANSRLIHYVLGNNAVDERLAADLHFFPPLTWQRVVIHESLRQRLQEIFQLAIENTAYRRPILYLHGRSGVGKKTVARALCSAKDLMLAAVDVRSLLRNPEAFQEKVRLILREGLLQPAAIYFGHLEKLESAAEENLWLLNGLLQEIAEFGWIIFLGSENPLPSALLNLPAICPVEVPAPDHAEQKALWKICLDGALSEKDMPNLDLLATRFDLTGGQIAQAIRRAQQVALVRDPKNGHLALADLMASSRLQSQPKLSVLARKIEPKYHWRDIVLPEDQMVQLRELANQLKHKQTVMEEWGFARKLSLGKGLNALFAGPSGTGKTMAAEVIAHELGLDLYKIDLSAVVSKYIGETEKNLNRVFTEAEYSNAILFFDEADALLGKRSEVKDAHDRYANIEIAYLLQKMEEYTGVTILSTNLKKNIDDAFVRRMQFIIDFPFPDEKHREKIWRVVFPPETPLSLDIDFKLLAKKLKITGGNIRNISLKAAYFAAADGRQITMNHLARATKREFQKMGKLYLEADFYRDGKVLD